jgi:hypothetical protein
MAASASQSWNWGDEMHRARIAFFEAGGLSFAWSEERRADGLVERIGQILAHPGIAPTALPQYQQAARLAFETAAADTEQPPGRP